MITEYAWWLALLCLLFAAGGAWFLYRNNPLSIEGKYAPLIKAILLSIRFLVLFFVAFLLVGPLLKSVTSIVQKPIVVVATDNSESILFAHDSASLKTTLTNQFTTLVQKLSNEFEVVPFLVGSKSEPAESISFTDKETNLSKLFTELKNRYDGANLGAVVLASDGLYTTGNNPLEYATDLKVPVYTIALGDTNQRKDVLIKNIRTNKLVFKNNSFPVEVDVAAFAANGNETEITIAQNGTTIFKQSIKLSNSFFSTIKAELKASNTSTQHIVVTARPIGGEVSLVNNRADVFVDVLENKQRVALLAYTPHPDISAYQNAIVSNPNYQVDVFVLSQQMFPKQLDAYNLIIAHQLPGNNGEGFNLLKQATDKKVPILYILGAQTNLSYLYQLQNLLQLGINRGATNEVLPVYNTNFSLFTLSTADQELLPKLPPLQALFGNYKITNEADVLFKQQIGYVKTEYPLMIFGKNNSAYTAVICGEGFWKWRIYDYALSGYRLTDQLISGTVQYLTSKKDKSRFRIQAPKLLNENEHLVIEADLYNESYQPVNTPEVSLTLTNEKGKVFNYTFTRTESNYRLDAGTFNPGKYTYKAIAQGITKPIEGVIYVKPLQVEFIETTANHQLLNELATQSNGKLLTLPELNQLADLIASNRSIKPVIYEQKEVKSWIELKWLLFLFIAFISLEWFIRKWNGSI